MSENDPYLKGAVPKGGGSGGGAAGVVISSPPNLTRAWRMDALDRAIKNFPGADASRQVGQAKLYEAYLNGEDDGLAKK